MKEKKRLKDKIPVQVPVVEKPSWIAGITAAVTTGGAFTGTCANSSCGKDCVVPLGETKGLCEDCWQKKKEGLLALAERVVGPKKRKASKVKTPTTNKKQKINARFTKRPGTPEREREVQLKRTTTPPNPKPKNTKFKVLFDA